MTTKLWIVPIAAIMILQGCTTATMSGFAEAASEDRMRSEDPDGYEYESMRRETDAMREEMEELEDMQRDMCRSSGGTVIGSSCNMPYRSPNKSTYYSGY